MRDRNCGYGSKRRKRESPPDLILIVTEGEKTEPNYFNRFRVFPKEIYEVKGVGRNTVSLVEKAKETAEKRKEEIAVKQKRRVKHIKMEVWCVFDRDSFTAYQFNRAIEIAENQGFKVAFSNEAFELWYLLHYNYYNTGITRDQYKTKLTGCLRKEYKKNSEEMYDVLRMKQKDAIRNAKKLEEYQSGISSPAKKNPCTTVYKLVEYLKRFTAGYKNTLDGKPVSKSAFFVNYDSYKNKGRKVKIRLT